MSASAERLSDKLRALGLMVATAESCTGGMIGAALTDLAGSSEIFERGFITYSNAAKEKMIGVPGALIREHGAVSAQVATAMARGALEQSRAELAVAVTGIAGPGGGSAEKPVGTVFIAYGNADAIHCSEHHFQGDRAAVRQQTVAAALDHLLTFVNKLA
jgi:nicotinamide-nucleotide amidase